MKIFASFLFGIITVPFTLYFLSRDLLPPVETFKSCIITKMHGIELCQNSKNYVQLKDISPHLQKTIILTEDSAFYQHHGFDWESIDRKFREGWEAGIFKKGGSTISQQLAKNMFLGREKTFLRKLNEALITDRLERTLSKKEILERYLNIVEFGKQIYGIKAAASFYFAKTPSELDVLESAFLALVLPNPIKYSKSFYKKELTPFAKNRLHEIINNLYQYKMISSDDYLFALERANTFFQPTTAADEDIDGTDPEE